MSKKCVAFSKSKLGLEKPDNRKAFYAGWEAAIREALAEPEITTPDVCGEVCARAKLCYGCNKSFDEALADHSGDANEMVAEPVKQEHTEQYWLHEINNARADGYERGYKAGKTEPVKQEPVAWMNKVANVFAQHPEGAKNFGCDIPLYAAPVDAKAILEMRDKAFQSYVDQAKADRELSVLQARLEALEEAAKVCDTAIIPNPTTSMFDAGCNSAVGMCAAAIRGLK